jgi:hypothetical protein
MKREIKASWYTGEPSIFDKKGHSAYDNPENYKEKQNEIIDYLELMEENYPDGWYAPHKTPAVVQVQSKVCRDKYFWFDLWEDDKSIDDQFDDFILWASKYCTED